MAGNEWINGYLEAILDSGAGIEDHKPENRGSSESRDLVGFNATKYFVEEVVTGFDETDIHRTWMKATATRNVKLRSARLENLCWRIWNLTRKKKQFELEHAQQSAKRYYQREQGHKDTTEDMSEDVSEGEKEKKKEQPEPQSKPVISLEPGHAESAPKERPVDQHKERRLYIVLISLHGLVRGDNMELGRDSDTGGQIKYVVEFARALAMVPEVYRVDLLTRQISSPDVDWSYGEPTEMLSVVSDDTDEQVGESSGAYIVRIPCGPRDKYLRKELLWPHIQEFVDGAMAHILNMTKVLGEQICGGDSIWPHVIHGHYADAGDIAALLSGALNVPMVLTGHSLGRNKLDQLLKQGRQSKEDINATYKIMRRIEAEELSLDAAELVITSTKQEIDEQWGLYDGFNVKLAKILRAREKRGVSCLGRYMPRMAVIPPGMDFSNVIVQDAGDVIEGDAEAAAYAANDATSVTPVSPRADPPIWAEIMRFFTNKHKPMILALARPDPKKNIINLLKAFGECRPLRELANLTLIMGNRDDIEEMSSANANVLVSALTLIDKYDLYGLVAYPKHHRQSDVPDIYRLAAKTKGVFINPALVEPFGLTLIEAAAHGLPMVATGNGGPVDIQRTLQNGLLVNPHDVKEIADALLKLLADRNLWIECRRNGLKNIHLYSWPQHCTNYLSKVALCRMRHPQWQNEESNGDADAESQGDSLRDVQDLSLRLSDDGERGSLCSSLLEKILRGTDRTADQVKEAYEKHKQGTKEENENKHGSGERYVQVNGQTVNRLPMLRRRRRLFVIAVDSYSDGAYPGKGMSNVIQEVFKAVKLDNTGRSTGFVLATALTLRETIHMLTSEGIAVKDFDALICSSGSQLYYPGASVNAEEIFNGLDMPMSSDTDYDIHIDHRWGGEGLRKVMARLSVSDAVTGQGKPDRIIIEEEGRCNSHCLAYQVKSTSNAPKVDELRQCLRMRGLRCHVIYCQNASKLHVLPLHASRSQALRYMFVRWGIDVANMFVIVGETGDTDYEELLAGTHKTIILKGAVKGTSEKLLRTNGSYTREDVAPAESPNIISTEEGYNSEDILNALVKLG